MIIDTNVSLSRWPFRRLPEDETPALAARLRSIGVSQAWAASFDALLHRDIGAVNARLAEECRRFGTGLLVPFGAVNPALPDWREDIRRCAGAYAMPGIRLHPNYHGYSLADPVFAEALAEAAARRLIVQIAVSMEDLRTQHPLVRVPPVDLAPLPDLARTVRTRLVLLNWWSVLRGKPLTGFLAAENLSFDIATVEGIEGIGRLVERIPAERLLYGSGAPLFSPVAASLKIRESGLEGPRLASILEGNAKGVLQSR